MGGKGSAPDAPDYSQIAAANEKAAEYSYKLGKEQLAWAKDKWNYSQGILDQIIPTQLEIMDRQNVAGQEAYDRYKNTFLPVEDQLIAEAQGYDTPGRREQEAGKAIADVSSAFDAQRRNALQRLESYGVDPSMTRSQALDLGVRTSQAAASAMAANTARQRVEDTGRALRADVVNLGRGMPSQVAQSYGQAIDAGSAGNANANQTIGNYMGSLGNPMGWQQMGNQSLANWGNTLNMGYQNQLAGWQANQQSQGDLFGGIGQLAGMGIGWAMGLADGGEVQGPGGPMEDKVPAQLSDGEYVVPADIVRRKGTEFFDNLIAKTRQAAPQPSQQDQGGNMVIPPPAAAMPRPDAPQGALPVGGPPVPRRVSPQGGRGAATPFTAGLAAARQNAIPMR